MNKNILISYSTTSIFILLWGAAAIFTKLGLNNSSPIILLVFRFLIALICIIAIGLFHHKLLPQKGTIKQVLLSGSLIVGGYSVCYFQAMAHGVTPGLIATIMGIQPIFTFFILEKRINIVKLFGLFVALSGLVILVWKSLSTSHISPLGISFSLVALFCMTSGTILQKNITQHPTQILPLQYTIGLIISLFFLPLENIKIIVNWEFITSILFLGFFISVIAQILFYKLLKQKNIVNVTSLFYLVPVVTALLDYFILGNKLPLSGLIGMFLIISGIFIVFKLKY